MAGFQKNDTDFDESQIGEKAHITLSPLAKSRLIIDGTLTAPREFLMDWMSDQGIMLADFSDNIPVESYGANYFRYADKIYMSAPICESQGDGNYSYKVRLYDITNGIDQAQNIGDTESFISTTGLSPMTSIGIVGRVPA